MKPITFKLNFVKLKSFKHFNECLCKIMSQCLIIMNIFSFLYYISISSA